MMTSKEEVKTRLVELVDPAYRTFNENIIPGAKNMLGVRMPVLRTIAREVARGDFRDYLAEPVGETYEEVMVCGLVVGYARWNDFDEFIRAVDAFVPLIDNWAVCDCFCSELKMTRRDTEQMMRLIEKYAVSGDEFSMRFAVVMLMDYFLTPDYVIRVAEILSRIDCRQYYVMMGVAWAVSVMMVKCRDEALDILTRGVLDVTTHNKAIQKCVESRRVSSADKEFLRMLRKLKI